MIDMKPRLLLLIPAAIMVLLGLVWVLQGVGLLKGGFMTGQTTWEVIGFMAPLVGLALGWLGLAGSRRSA
jgi:hypothetical protein